MNPQKTQFNAFSAITGVGVCDSCDKLDSLTEVEEGNATMSLCDSCLADRTQILRDEMVEDEVNELLLKQ